MWDCIEVQKLLKQFSNLLKIFDISFLHDKQSFILSNTGITNRNNRVDNEITVIIKQYIYRMKCFHKSLNINALMNVIKDYYDTQKQIMNSKEESIKERFTNEWANWKNILDIKD